MSNDEYIRRVQITHPEYDYSITNYTGINNSIQYICPSHGVITQSAHDIIKLDALNVINLMAKKLYFNILKIKIFG